MCNLNAFYGIGIRIIILDTHGDIIDVGYRGCVAALYEYLYLISLALLRAKTTMSKPLLNIFSCSL